MRIDELDVEIAVDPQHDATRRTARMAQGELLLASAARGPLAHDLGARRTTAGGARDAGTEHGHGYQENER